jgi:hypothetical protein
MDMTNELKLAVLIDADNIPYANIKGMLEEIAKYGTPTFKRIYGDWTRPSLSGWKAVLLENAITPIQQYSYTKGKNSTDSALIIDAMDILYTSQVDGFCIISSDSDFTRLATRLREAGKKVFGMGEKKTPMSFIASCNKFIYIEILQTEARAPRPPAPASRISKEKIIPVKVIPEKLPQEPVVVEKPAEITPVNDAVIRLIGDSISDLAEEDGWVSLSMLGALVMKKKPDFDARNYGFKKLVDLVKSVPQIEIDKRASGKNNVSHFYVRLKETGNE